MILQNDPRRWEERADGRMIPDDRNAFANLSPEVFMKEIPHHNMAYGLPHAPMVENVGALTQTFMGVVKSKGRI